LKPHKLTYQVSTITAVNHQYPTKKRKKDFQKEKREPLDQRRLEMINQMWVQTLFAFEITREK
jgi:hypothetical protein